MASFRKRGRVWYYRYVDADGVQHERKGCPDRRETEAMAAAAEAEASKVRAGLIDPKALGFRDPRGPAAGRSPGRLQGRPAGQGRNRNTPVVTRNRAEQGSDAGPSQASLRPVAVQGRRPPWPRSDPRDFGQETINHHVRAVKAFSAGSGETAAPGSMPWPTCPRATPRRTAAAADAP